MSSKDLEFTEISSLPLISLVPKTIDVVGDADVCNGEVADDVESEDLSFFKSRRKNPVVGSWNRTSKPRHWCPPARKTTHFCVRMLYEIESYLMNWTRVTNSTYRREWRQWKRFISLRFRSKILGLGNRKCKQNPMGKNRRAFLATWVRAKLYAHALTTKVCLY